MLVKSVYGQGIGVKGEMDEEKKVMDETIVDLPVEEEQTDVIRELRDLPPAHFLFKIQNFSLLRKLKVDNYESSDFEVGGYKWRLSLYPEGKKKVNENGHISLYLVLSGSNSVSFLKDVNVHFKLFLYNQLQDKYLTVQDAKGIVRRFRGVKREWGFDQLVPLNVFCDASNGYLIDDCCIFGAEVFVIEPSRKGECASVVKELDNNTFTWNVQNYAQLNNEFYKSQVFMIGGHKWTLKLYPKGYSKEKGHSLSLFLHLEDLEALNPGQKLYTKYIFRVRDQNHGKHHELKASNQFSASEGNWGFSNLIRLSNLNDKLLGYMVNGAVSVEVEILLMVMIKDFS